MITTTATTKKQPFARLDDIARDYAKMAEQWREQEPRMRAARIDLLAIVEVVSEIGRACLDAADPR